MREIAAGLWTVEVPLRFLGIEVGRRMSVVRLEGDGLWLHSPAPLTGELRASLEALGEPRYVVAASAVHGHRFMEQYRNRYPDLELFAAPGLDRRRKDLAFDGLLGTTPDPRWRDEIDQTVFLGHLLPEVLFFHRASRTLIVGDLLVHERRPEAPLATRLGWRLEGGVRLPGHAPEPSRDDEKPAGRSLRGQANPRLGLRSHHRWSRRGRRERRQSRVRAGDELASHVTTESLIR